MALTDGSDSNIICASDAMQCRIILSNNSGVKEVYHVEQPEFGKPTLHLYPEHEGADTSFLQKLCKETAGMGLNQDTDPILVTFADTSNKIFKAMEGACPTGGN